MLRLALLCPHTGNVYTQTLSPADVQFHRDGTLSLQVARHANKARTFEYVPRTYFLTIEVQ